MVLFHEALMPGFFATGGGRLMLEGEPVTPTATGSGCGPGGAGGGCRVVAGCGYHAAEDRIAPG
jgi:hypothetical protein